MLASGMMWGTQIPKSVELFGMRVFSSGIKEAAPYTTLSVPAAAGYYAWQENNNSEPLSYSSFDNVVPSNNSLMMKTWNSMSISNWNDQYNDPVYYGLKIRSEGGWVYSQKYDRDCGSFVCTCFKSVYSNFPSDCGAGDFGSIPGMFKVMSPEYRDIIVWKGEKIIKTILPVASFPLKFFEIRVPENHVAIYLWNNFILHQSSQYNTAITDWDYVDKHYRNHMVWYTKEYYRYVPPTNKK